MTSMCIKGMGRYSAVLLLLLCASNRAEAAPAPTIEKLAGPVRSRILTGTSSEGTSVEAIMQNGQYIRIVAEALNENGRTTSDFRFDNGRATRARVIRVGYKGYPDVDLVTVPPHNHLVVDPTDVVISDQAYDLTPRAPPCASTECASGRKEARTQAQLYVRFMNTPPKHGTAEDAGYWDCIGGADQGCTSFKQE